MYCPKCGSQNDDNNYRCTNCKQLLHPVQPARPSVTVQTDATLGGLIPYKNARALIAYYLGIFSLIPFFGIFMGIAALILGIQGLRFADKHPEAKGKIHAWVGMIAGGFFALVYLVGFVMIMLSVFFKS